MMEVQLAASKAAYKYNKQMSLLFNQKEISFENNEISKRS